MTSSQKTPTIHLNDSNTTNTNSKNNSSLLSRFGFTSSLLTNSNNNNSNNSNDNHSGIENSSNDRINITESTAGHIEEIVTRTKSKRVGRNVINNIVDDENNNTAKISVVTDRITVGNITITNSKEMENPKKSIAARKRVIQTNKSPIARKEIEKKITFSNKRARALRCQENPDCFRIIANRLWCFLCDKEVGCHKSHCADHLDSQYHKDKDKNKSIDIENEMILRDKIKDYFDKTRAKGENLDEETLIFRISYLKSILEAGIPISKIDVLRVHEEKYCKLKLTNSTHMRQYIPLILEEEIDKIMIEIKGNYLVVIFDGTTKVDECFAIVFRWVTENLNIHQRLIHLGRYKSSFKHEELVSAVIRSLGMFHVDMGEMRRVILRKSQVLSFQRDRASVNSAAVKILINQYIGSLDLECLSHTLTHPGEHMKAPVLLKFKQDLCALVKDSYAFKNHWFQIIGTSFKQPGNFYC